MQETDSTEVKPLPCPFCGNEDIDLVETEWGHPAYYCDVCHAWGGDEEEEGQSAIQKWNQRIERGDS